MCSIAGLVSRNDSAEQRKMAVRATCEAMRHRGPDDRGKISRGPATPGMRRLAVVEPAGGHQPMTSASGSHHSVFGGCIHNHGGLRAKLTAGGYRPARTRFDAKGLPAALVRWGDACPPRRRGRFAFAVWMRPEPQTFLEDDFTPASVARIQLFEPATSRRKP